MSRSYKHTPYCGEHKGKVKKRRANKSVRAWLKRHPEVTLPYNSYKKLYCSYNICDYRWISTWPQYWAFRRRYWPAGQLDKKKEYRHWLKTFKNK